MYKEKRIEDINNLILELASGNFSASGSLSEHRDEFDAIITGINMLGEELRASTVSRDYLKNIFRGIVDMLIVLDNNYNIIEVNKTVTDLLKYNDKELVGEPFTKLFAGPKASIKTVNKKLSAKGFCYNIERVFKGKEGNKIPVSCSASLLYDNAENVQGILFIAKDISKIKQTEEDLKLKNQELDTFIYKAAHDLKGPVASIMGITNIAPIDVKDPVALKYFEMVQQCTEKLDKVLIHLREIAAIDKAHKDKRKIDFISEVQSILDHFQNSEDFKKLKVFLDIQDVQNFYSNPKMLRMVFHNLIDNAIKFQRDTSNPFVRVKVKESKNSCISILVEDNGIGIKKKLHHKVFNMFFRAHTASEGSGLGLYMVKAFIKAMRGEVEMKSIENKGTCFSIELPNME